MPTARDGGFGARSPTISPRSWNPGTPRQGPRSLLRSARRAIPAFAALGCILLGSACRGTSPVADGLERRPPSSPADALRSFRIADGFEIELAASEPQVSDPIAMAFDADGRLYVAEMRGYPFDPPPDGGVPGRVRLLEDTDADGVFETARVFADRLHWPSGIACFKGGIFVTAAPDIVYLKDTDGDGVADERRTIFTGFGTGKSEDIVNNLKWGMDHRIYGTTSYNGGTVRHAERSGDRPIPLGSNDFRFDPVSEVIEAVEGTGGDFGTAFDAWGNRFGSNSGNPAIHAVFPLHRSLEGMQPSRLSHRIYESDLIVSPVSEPEPWRVARKTHWSRWVNTTLEMRAQRFPPRELATQGYYTGGAGLGIYKGGAFPQPFRGNVFAPEPAGNLVVRMAVERNGVTFRARRPNPVAEFLASTDNWFRPVNIANGPDGALYLLDMYREVIEDPSAIPDEILEHIDFYSGNDMGRIYRIRPADFQPGAPPSLEGMRSEDLVPLLQHENAWWRSTAQRLLFERRPGETAGQIAELAKDSLSAEGRLHALWTLHGIDRISDATLSRSLSDPHPAVRQAAVRLAEPRLAASGALRRKVAEMASDEDIAVRFRVALAAPEFGNSDPAPLLAKILLQDPGDEWIRAAVFAGAMDDSLALLEILLQDESFRASADSHGAIRQLAANVAFLDSIEAVEAVLAMTREVPGSHGARIRVAAAAGAAAGLERRGSSMLAVSVDPGRQTLRDAVDSVLNEAKVVAASNRGAVTAERLDAVGLLSWAPPDVAIDTLGSLLAPGEPDEVQLSAVRSLGAHAGSQVGTVLSRGWRSYSPAVRREALEVLFGRDERLLPFLDALASGEALVAHLDPMRRAALRDHRLREIRTRARQILEHAEPVDPAQAIERYRPALGIAGNADRGAGVFERECATCHRLGEVGHQVGPDLVERASSDRVDLLIDILDPNRTVQSNFVNYRLDANDGRVVTGILVRESAGGVTLRRGEGVEDFVARSDIEFLTSMGLSLMPEGLGDEVGPEEMADLLAFINSFDRR